MKKKILLPSLSVLYVLILLAFTVFSRSRLLRPSYYELFWSYKRWFSGDWALGREILANIAMFFPVGFLLSAIFEKSGKRSLLIVILCSLLLSLSIERLQFNLLRGSFEYDDLLNNTLGGILGFLGFRIFRKLLGPPESGEKEKKEILLTAALGILFLIAGLSSLVSAKSEEIVQELTIFCFQIDKASVDGDAAEFSGFAFLYNRLPGKFSLKLKSSSGRLCTASTVYGIPRDDVNEYFLCSTDYSSSGFSASIKGLDPLEEYEFVASFGWLMDFNTGVYLRGSDILCTSPEKFAPPDVSGTDLQTVVDNGFLRAYQPDHHFWIYQYDGSVYLIADQDFTFEEDGLTYLEYQLWTTQTEKLPEHRLENNWLWDNIGGHFEAYELHGNLGPYRVMKREIPTEYSVTAIDIAYFVENKLVWRQFFRPFYIFSDNSSLSMATESSCP